MTSGVSISVNKKTEMAYRSAAHEAYSRIREDIIDARLAPGKKLKLNILMEKYSVGMSPLREALSRLAGDKLVVAKDQRGFWVAPFSLDDLDDIIETKALIEAEALTRSIARGDELWEQKLREVYGALYLVENEMSFDNNKEPPSELISTWRCKNHAFHSTLVSACGSPSLLGIFEMLSRQTERYLRANFLTGIGDTVVRDEHEALYNAALNRNSLRACTIAEAHFRRAMSEVRQAVLIGAETVRGDD